MRSVTDAMTVSQIHRRPGITVVEIPRNGNCCLGDQ